MYVWQYLRLDRARLFLILSPDKLGLFGQMVLLTRYREYSDLHVCSPFV